MNHKLFLLLVISLCAVRAFAAAPTISGFSPASGVLSSTVTITGTNFVSPVTVSFNGVASTLVSVSSSTTIHATVPTTAGSGTITVATGGGSASSSSAFTVLPGVAVTPSAVGPPTSSVTLYYSGFSALEAIDLYFDTDDIALSSASGNGAGNFPVTIPAGARPGSHWFTAIGRHSGNSAQFPFTVRTNWPQFGFMPNHKGKNRYENVLSTATVGDLDEAWRTPLIGTMQCTPAVVNGIVYATFGDGSIRAFDETTGAQKWSHPTGGYEMESGPAVANGIVYAGSDDSSVYALDAVTGALKWSHATGGAVLSSPNVVNGIVYVGSYDDNVYALNAMTGAVVWTFLTGGAVYSSPIVANGVVYVGSFDDSVYALNAANGAKIWKSTTTGGFFASPTLTGGFIWVRSTGGIMYGLYASTGAQAWTYPISGGYGIYSSAAAVGGSIYFGSINGYLYSLSCGGAYRWSAPVPSGGEIESPVCVANGVVYATAGDYTYAYDQNSGALLTTLSVGNIIGGPAVVNGAVFTGNTYEGVLARYTLNGLLSNYVAPRPDPLQLRPHPLR